MCSGGRSDLTVSFKLPAQKMLIMKISEKSVEKQRKCTQISPPAFLSIAPFKGTKTSRNEQKSLRNSKKNYIFCECAFTWEEKISIKKIACFMLSILCL
jgi:hypothetical protein